jgi:hypothetical protein
VIEIPTNLAVNPAGDNPSGEASRGWIIGPAAGGVSVAPGWIVNRADRTLSIPVGWYLRSSGTNRGGVISSDPSATLEGFGENLAHFAAQARAIS